MAKNLILSSIMTMISINASAAMSTSSQVISSMTSQSVKNVTPVVNQTTVPGITTQQSFPKCVGTDQPTKKIVKRKYKKAAYKQPASSYIDSITFDFSYSGDVSGVPTALRKYDSKLQILPSSGAVTPVPVNIDLQNVKLQDVIDAVNNQTNGQAKLIYTNNALMLNYANTVDVGKDAVDESLKWQKGGAPKPVLKRDGVVRFPFGEYQPVITCQPQQICDVELQSGEDINGIAIGDSTNWNEGDSGIPIIYSGTAGNLTPHLVLKPNRGGLETSLMITTSRRTYMIKLKSSYNGYIARVGFYYPDEMIQKFETNKQDIRNQSTNIASNTNNPQGTMVDLSKINNNYSMDGDDYPWKPTEVYDDGTHVYIQMPISVDPRSLPGLCVLVEGDDTETKCEFVNFKYDNHIYIVDKLFDKARLMNGYGDYQQVITITRNPKKGFWSRLFGG